VTRPVWLDAEGAAPASLGAGRGFGPRRRAELRPALRRAREEVRAAAVSGALPYVEPLVPLPGLPRPPLVVTGEPAALRAVRVLSLGVAGLRFTAAPGDEGLTPGLVVPGPSWAGGGPWASGAGAPTGDEVDPRFGAVSPFALGLLDAAGGDVGAVQRAVADLVLALADPAVDPAAGLAGALLALALDPGGVELGVMGAGRRGRAVAAHLADVFSMIALGEVDGPVRRGAGLRARRIAAGDEAAAGWLAAVDRRPWLLTVESADEPLVAVHRRLHHDAGGPVLRLRLGGDGPELGACAALIGVEAALTVAVALGLPPLALPAADALRQALPGPAAPGVEAGGAPG